MQEKLLINGNFLNRNLTGIERFSFEVLARFDSLLKAEDDVSILISANAKFVPQYKNIKILKSKKEISSFPKWDLFEFKKACKKNKATGLSFSNTAPLGKYCGYAFIHDIYAVDFPQDFTSKKEKLIKLYCKLNYKNIARNAKKVLTVSAFSKKQIQNAYKVEDSRIEVIPNGWEHFFNVKEDDSIFEKYPDLKKESFYFTLGSLQKRKNLKWIVQYAKDHSDEKFAISGKVISGLESKEISQLKNLENVTLLGYVSDEEVKALMKNCKAFVFPSYYEGFGIPPLEALSVGARIIVAKSASLPEIYGDAAVYIDAQNPCCNLNELLENTNISDTKVKEVLEKYTYQNAAEKLYKVIFEK